ncbi:MAG: Hsp20/alpha crystallin family protein [Acidobacteriota bacterium]
MGSAKFDPFEDFERMHRRLEGLLRHLLREPHLHPRLEAQQYWTPAVDVYETATQYVVLVELAGVQRDRLDVTLDGRRLTLSGERREPHAQEDKQHLHRMEIDYGRFLRIIDLPEEPESDSIEAHYENGFLRIRIPRKSRNRPVVVEVELDRE